MRWPSIPTGCEARTIGRVAAIAASLLLWVAAEGLAQQRPTDELIRYYQARLARRPDDLRTYTRLGQAYILKARESGDPAYYDLAGQALGRGLALSSDPVTAARTATELALVQMARHQFREALATARKAVAQAPGEVAAHGPIGDALIELGDYAQAEAAYEKMRGLTGPFYPHSRLAALMFLKGDAAGAIAEMRRAVGAAIAGNQPREHIAWARFRLGSLLFATGDLAGAGAAQQEALAYYPGYHRALAGLAQVRAAEGRYPEAVELYRKALGVIPQPDYAAGLGDVYAKMGRADEARKQYDLVEYVGRLNALNQVLYNRELALFYLDHDMKPADALDLARKELEVRRDIYTHDVLAWALYRNGRPAEALAHVTEALRLHTKDARLLYHAALVYRALGDADRARAHLERALAINPHFHLLQADAARRALAELGGRAGRP
jgi:tetratricopeptide (TPR) repeat protein